ncbi:MAG TPA: ECF-type sigma factor [Planctomycetota bacterium]|nr:ECF-type sigma factor [Planctomycetota bacterium]
MPLFLDPQHRAQPGVDERLYAELRKVAAACLRGERSDHTFSPTDLVHEACLRLLPGGTGASMTGAEIRRLAARTMRRVLVDHARRRSAEKRDGDRRVALDHDVAAPAARDAYVVALETALVALAEEDDELVAVVELLFFGGCTVQETARTLGMSERTVKRRWRLAKGWLHRRIAADAAD